MLLIRSILRARIKALNERIRYDLEQLAEAQGYLNACRQIANEVDALNEKDPTFKSRFFASENFNEQPWLARIRAQPDAMRLVGLLRDLQWLQGRRDGADVRRTIKAYLSTRINPKEVENLAFAGGGAKGLAYAGVLEVLEKKGALANIKRVSGTSAGAIIGMTAALGFTSKEVKDIVRNKHFTHFLYESPFNRREQLPPHLVVLDLLTDAVSPRKRELMRDAEYLKCYKIAFEEKFFQYILTFPDGFTGDASGRQEEMASLRAMVSDRTRFGYADQQSLLDLVEGKPWFQAMHVEIQQAIDKQLRVGKPRFWLFGEVVKPFGGFDDARHAAETCIRYMRNEDTVEQYFADLIQGKLQRLTDDQLEVASAGLSNEDRQRDLTFRELHSLAKLYPEMGFKDLYVCVARKKDNSIFKLLDKNNYERVDVSHDTPAGADYRNMPIKTAVRMSMNIPGAFRSIEFKGKYYVDGGVRANFPVDVFDNRLSLPKNKTISFFLTPEENYLRASCVERLTNPDSSEIPLSLNPFAYVSHYAGLALGRMMKDFQSNVLNDGGRMHERDFHRIMSINVENVKTEDFDAARADIEAIQANGAVAARAVFRPRYDLRIHFLMHRITLGQAQVKDLQASHDAWAVSSMMQRLRENVVRWVGLAPAPKGLEASSLDAN